jgi:hypothetical protein
MRCPSCDHDNRPERRFCAECGAALAPVCAACGAANQPGEKFCGGCGAALIGAPPPPAARPHPPAASAAPTDTGERHQLTIVFSDLVGGTEQSTQLDPEEWRDRVAQYHRATAWSGRWSRPG